MTAVTNLTFNRLQYANGLHAGFYTTFHASVVSALGGRDIAKEIIASKKKSTSNRTKKIKSTQKKKATSNKKSAILLGTCFVMMPFKEPFNLYYDSIFKPAIKSANLEPIRADDLFRPSVIVADLWQMIQDAKVLLAELTTKNANVFYELGLAHAIGKPIVLVAETMNDVPFDLQQLRVLLYDKDDPSWGMMEIELRRIRNYEELDSWIRKWYGRGYSTDQLGELIRNTDFAADAQINLDQLVNELS